MPRSPENKEAPNASERKPRKEPKAATIRALGRTAVKGAKR